MYGVGLRLKTKKATFSFVAFATLWNMCVLKCQTHFPPVNTNISALVPQEWLQNDPVVTQKSWSKWP